MMQLAVFLAILENDRLAQNLTALVRFPTNLVLIGLLALLPWRDGLDSFLWSQPKQQNALPLFSLLFQQLFALFVLPGLLVFQVILPTIAEPFHQHAADAPTTRDCSSYWTKSHRSWSSRQLECNCRSGIQGNRFRDRRMRRPCLLPHFVKLDCGEYHPAMSTKSSARHSAIHSWHCWINAHAGSPRSPNRSAHSQSLDVNS